MKNHIKPGFIALAMSLLMIAACDKDDKETTPTSGTFKLEFAHNFDGNTFAFNQDYTNGSGETVSFTKVRYYITNVKLEKTDGTVWAEENSYHLVDVKDESSLTLTFPNVPVGEYHSISYMIGVDSVRNVSGAQEGALSPDNNMFWSWNNGYIFFKVEGHSPQSTSSSFAYHIGGFSGPNNAITVNTHDMHDHTLSINGNSTPELHMEVDLKHFFDDMYTLSVASTPTVHMPGVMALHLAHNFQSAFSLAHTHN